MKTLLTLMFCLVLSLAYVNAQTKTNPVGNDVKLSSSNGKPVKNLLADSVFFYGNTPKLYSYANSKGYIFGNNTFGDLGKYQRFDSDLKGNLKEVTIFFAVKEIVGTADSFDVVVRKVNSTTGAPSDLIALKKASTADIDTANMYNTYSIVAPVDGPFFVGFEFGNTYNDTIAAINDAPGEGNGAKRAWEKWSDGTFDAVSNGFTAGFDADMWVEAVINVVPLPVQLTSFTATSNGDKVSLNWATSTETNNKGFVVERKLNNGSFAVVAKLNGKGTTTESNSYSFTDSYLKAGKYTYRLKQEDYDGSFSYSNEVLVSVTGVNNYSLAQNYPNPFNPSTVINFTLKSNAFVSLKVYNLIGQEVRTLINGNMEAGVQNVKFNAGNLESGIYIYSLEVKGIDGSNFSSTKKMMLVK